MIESKVKPSVMQAFVDWQSEEVALEKMENPTKTATIIASK